MDCKLQVEPNAHKIEEHRRKYERLRKEREAQKIERERQRQRAEANVFLFLSAYINSLSSMIPVVMIRALLVLLCILILHRLYMRGGKRSQLQKIKHL